MAYTYAHRRNDTGAIFYIGKGSGIRHRVTGDRNKHWWHVYNKVGRTSEILMDDLTDDEAFELEELVIETIGLENLVNYSKGGDRPPIVGKGTGLGKKSGKKGNVYTFAGKFAKEHGIPKRTIQHWIDGDCAPNKTNKKRCAIYRQLMELINQGKDKL